RLLALREPPTAIFGSNDEIAAGVLAAANSAGLNVPYDLSIAGFEDSPFSRQSWPALTTAKQATGDIARHAARLLISQLRTGAYDDRPVQLHIQGCVPQLVVRGSTAPLRQQPSRNPSSPPDLSEERSMASPTDTETLMFREADESASVIAAQFDRNREE